MAFTGRKANSDTRIAAIFGNIRRIPWEIKMYMLLDIQRKGILPVFR